MILTNEKGTLLNETILELSDSTYVHCAATCTFKEDVHCCEINVLLDGTPLFTWESQPFFIVT